MIDVYSGKIMGNVVFNWQYRPLIAYNNTACIINMSSPYFEIIMYNTSSYNVIWRKSLMLNKSKFIPIYAEIHDDTLNIMNSETWSTNNTTE